MARHAPRCAECGAPTRPQRSGGVPSLVCVACGATTVDPRGAAQVAEAKGDPTAPPVRSGLPEAGPGLPDDLTLEEPVLSVEGLAALGEAGFESELEHLRSQRRRQLGMLVLMGAGGLAFAMFIPVVVLGVSAVRMMLATDVSLPAPELPAAVEEPVPQPEPDVPEEEAEPEEEEEEERDGEEPAVAPEPQPPAPEPQANPVQVYIQKGWKVASREPVAGAEAFRKALELSPRHPEASYGLGYCLLKQEDLTGAQQHLCVARTSSKADIRRDVDALLANNGLACSP